MSIGSFGGSLSSASLPWTVASGFTAPRENPYSGIPLVEQIGLRKAANARGIANANRYAAINSGSDRNLVLTISSNASSAANSCQSSSLNSLRTISTTGTSIVSLSDAIQRPDARPAADVTADIADFREKHTEFLDDNWRDCFVAVEKKCLETDAIGYHRQLAYEELLRRWQSNRLATSRSTLPSQDAAGPVVDDASAPVMVKRGRLRAESVAICSSGHPDISSVSNRGPSSLWSSRSNTPGSLPSIVESPEQESQEEDSYHDGGVVANRAPLAQRGSDKSMWRKRTTERDPSLGEISPCPSSKTDRFECDVPRSAEQSSADDETRYVQDESIKTGNHLDLQRVSPGPKIKRLAFIHREPHLSDDQQTKPHSELASLNLESPDPPSVSLHFRDSAPPRATTPTCETPISPSPSLQSFKLDPASPATSQSSQSPSSLLGSDLDYNSAPTSEALQSPVITQTSSTAKVEEAPSDREAVKGNSAEKHRKGIRSRLRARLKKPDRWNLEPGPRQTMSRENLQCWWARRAARRKERRARPPELEESDLTSMSFTGSSVSSVTKSEGSGKEFSVGSRHDSENGSESPAESSSGTSGRRPGFEAERRRPVKVLPAENAQPRQPNRRGRFPKFSRSRPRTGHQSLLAKFQRRKKPSRIGD
jgi:hypothetical protein